MGTDYLLFIFVYKKGASIKKKKLKLCCEGFIFSFFFFLMNQRIDINETHNFTNTQWRAASTETDTLN